MMIPGMIFAAFAENNRTRKRVNQPLLDSKIMGTAPVFYKIPRGRLPQHYKHLRPPPLYMQTTPMFRDPMTSGSKA
jgi:hypothetical protein